MYSLRPVDERLSFFLELILDVLPPVIDDQKLCRRASIGQTSLVFVGVKIFIKRFFSQVLGDLCVPFEPLSDSSRIDFVIKGIPSAPTNAVKHSRLLQHYRIQKVSNNKCDRKHQCWLEKSFAFLDSLSANVPKRCSKILQKCEIITFLKSATRADL